MCMCVFMAWSCGHFLPIFNCSSIISLSCTNMHMCLIPDFLVCFTILAQELANCFLRDQRESILGTGPYTVETTWYSIKYVCSNESLFIYKKWLLACRSHAWNSVLSNPDVVQPYLTAILYDKSYHFLAHSYHFVILLQSIWARPQTL